MTVGRGREEVGQSRVMEVPGRRVRSVSWEARREGGEQEREERMEGEEAGRTRPAGRRQEREERGWEEGREERRRVEVQEQGGVKEGGREIEERLGRRSRWVGREVRPEALMSREEREGREERREVHKEERREQPCREREER